MYWMVEETKEYYVKNYAFPEGCYVEEVLQRVYDRVEEDRIRISYKEIRKRYRKKQTRINERAKCDLNLEEQHSTEKAVFTNMCMVQDDCGRVVALDKVDGGYRGTTFPGGHLEEGETFCESVIREVREETGLEIRNPVFCGIYHWYKGGVHNVILLYRADEFSGELKSSEEGLVYWIPLADYRRKELAGGMDQVLKIVAAGEAGECYMHLEGGKYQEYLFGKTAAGACLAAEGAAEKADDSYEGLVSETFTEAASCGKENSAGKSDASYKNLPDKRYTGTIQGEISPVLKNPDNARDAKPDALQTNQHDNSYDIQIISAHDSKRDCLHEESGKNSRPKNPQKEMAEKILTFCEQERTRREIASFCGYKDIRYVSEKYLNPLLRAGELKMTLPQTPRSKNQKYIRVVR